MAHSLLASAFQMTRRPSEAHSTLLGQFGTSGDLFHDDHILFDGRERDLRTLLEDGDIAARLTTPPE